MIALPEGTTSLLVDGERVLVQGDKQALVASKSHAGEWHTVSFEWDDEKGREEWICTCMGFSVRHECRHVRAIDRWNAGRATVRFARDEAVS